MTFSTLIAGMVEHLSQARPIISIDQTSEFFFFFSIQNMSRLNHHAMYEFFDLNPTCGVTTHTQYKEYIIS